MLRSRMYLGEIHFGDLQSARLLARLGVLRCGSCGSRMVINSYTGSYRCGDSSANRCRRRAAVKADRVEEMVLDAVRAYSATADMHGRASRKQQIREADKAIDPSNAPTRISITRSGSSASLDCWAGPPPRRP